MNFIKILIGLPLLFVIIMFAIVNNDFASFSFWPSDYVFEVPLTVAILFLIFLGFVLGLLFSWLSHAPVRKALRKQKKENKKLNKEQVKLVKEVKGLHENIETLKTDDEQKPKVTIKEKFKNIFKSKKNEN